MKDAFPWMKRARFSLLALIAAATLLVSGCGGSDSYTEPQVATNAPISGAATNVLVEPSSLKSWMDKGLVNNEDGFNKTVVILDFGPYTMDSEKDPERISGACRVKKADLESPRFEGVALANPMVATGEQMDAVLQRLGIDKDTTIVFTTSGASYYATRAYWTFRYWGFPREQLKLLNGGNAAFAGDFPELMTREIPTPTASTFSVRNLDGTQPDLRASVGEMIEVFANFDDEKDVVLDARGDAFYNGTKATSGLVGGDVVVVDGHPIGGGFLGQGTLFADGKFKTPSEIEAMFTAKGWAPGKRVTVYCTSGYSATPLFFALDALLGADVQLYDGSWSQLGKYSDYAVADGQLPAGSPWSIDRYLDFSAARYNYRYLNVVSAGYVIETLNLDEDAEAINPFLPDVNDPAGDSDVNPLANQIEEEDAAYVGDGAPLSFPAPVATATSGVLIDASTLEGWFDAGLVNAALGAERVVILDVTDSLSYSKGHIPGAVHWDISKHAMTRTEGPAPTVNMVVTGERMDQLIQAAGIDENTTIVITSSQSQNYFPSRAYFLFRYYGFPKERLKVLNGYNGAWNPAALVSSSIEVTPSTLSVKDIANHQPDLRVSLAEFLDALRDERGVPVDFRGVKTDAASTPGVFPDVPGDYVVFEGRLKNGQGYVWKKFNVDYDGGDLTFKDAAAIEADLNTIGLDGTQMVYSYCRTGYVASSGFFVLDAILNWDVMTYDGSWSQFGKMSADADMGGELPEGSPWAADNDTYMDAITYNKAATRMQKIEALNPDADILKLLPSSLEANQVENADADYSAAGGADEGGASGPPTPVAPPAAGC